MNDELHVMLLSNRNKVTVLSLHRQAMNLYCFAREIVKGRAEGDAVLLYRESLDLERKAYVMCKHKFSKKVLYTSYKSIQAQLRKLTWKGK